MTEEEIRAAIASAVDDYIGETCGPEVVSVVMEIFAPIIRERDDLRAGADFGRRMMDELYQELGEYRLAAEAEADLFDEARQYANEQRQRAERILDAAVTWQRRSGVLSEAVARVRELHPREDAHHSEWFDGWCPTCTSPWPCRTLKALDGTDGGQLLLNLEQRPDHSRDTHPLALDDTEEDAQ